MNDSNVINLFLAAAQRQPRSIALIHENDTITFEQLLKEVRQTACYYTGRGIKEGDKVLVLVPVCIDLYRIVLSLFYMGACPVFIDEWVSMDRLNQCCKVVNCTGLVADTKNLMLSYFVTELRNIRIKIPGRKKGTRACYGPQATIPPNDTALITFTTGSTGIPKAADRTHAFLKAQFDALIPYLNDAFHPSLVTLPIVVLINLGLGKPTVLPPRGFAVKKPETVRILKATLKAHRAETIITSPSILHNLVSGNYDNDSIPIKKIITGGGPVLPGLAVIVTKAFPQAERIAVYGSTEAEPISHIAFDELMVASPLHILSLGLPVGKPDRAIKISIIPYTDSPVQLQTDLSWRQMKLAENMVGEIVVAGPHVLKLYLNNKEAIIRNKIIVDGEVWHRTGDAGRLDESGDLYFYGLCKEIIFCGAKTYYPLLVSQAVRAFAPAKQAALLLLDDELTIVLECVKPIENGTLRAMLDKVGIGGAHVCYVEKIPTDPRHQTKIDYDKLRALLKK
jgi:acyl-CoA synthetase (AMP-forming)/AMP-acid ligase II